MIVTKVDVTLDAAAIEHVKSGQHLADKRGIIAYCQVWLDNCFLLREVRVVGEIDGTKVQMPDRKISIRFSCGHKNLYDNNYCGDCGKARAATDVLGEGIRRFMDMCHPTNPEFRRHMNERVITAVWDLLAVEAQSSAS